MDQTRDLDLIDTHAHLDMAPLSDDQQGAILRAQEAGVSQIITIGTDLESSESAAALASRFAGVFAAIGIHPHDAALADSVALKRLEGLASLQKVVAIGEIGLDFAKEYPPKSLQKEAFISQLDLAKRANLPVVIHDRSAHEETLDVLAGFEGQGIGGVLHCFSGDIAMAERVFELGFFISVTGIITFPKTDALKDVVRQTPLQNLLIETDCPFLSPAPFRGRPNEPARVGYIAREISRLKNMPLEEVARCTSANARRLFRLPHPQDQ